MKVLAYYPIKLWVMFSWLRCDRMQGLFVLMGREIIRDDTEQETLGIKCF